jgi:ABC-2 type transport system ATP-binding protein
LACKSYAELMANSIDTPDLYGFARHASVESYVHRIRIPTLLMQGQGDSLFNLQEAVATYRSLRKQHTPVKMIWQSWGHSIGASQPGEWTQGPGALKTYEGKRVFAWFARYLKGKHVKTGPRFAYYRDYVPFHGKGPDTVQYGHASHFPVGHVRSYYASGTSSLVSKRRKVEDGSMPYANTSGATPLSYSEVSEVQGSTIPDQSTVPYDTPGSFVAWEGPPLKHHIDVAGIPTAVVNVSDPDADRDVPVTQLEFFAKVYDIAPDGTIDLVRRLVAPVRAYDVSKPVHVQLPGIVHRFEKGHHIELVIAATDSAYRNSNAVQPAIASTSKKHPTVLRLPIVR